MNFQFYLEKLKNSEEFKKFKKEFPKAFLCSSFFIINKQGKKEEFNLDYFIPTENKIFSFQLLNNFKKIELKNYSNKPFEEISESINFDFKKIDKIIKDKFQENNLKDKLQKIILSLQNKNKKNYLIGTIFISSLGIINVKIDLDKMKFIDFNKKSLFDMVKIFGKK